MSKTYSSGDAFHDKVVAPSHHNTKTIAVEKYLYHPFRTFNHTSDSDLPEDTQEALLIIRPFILIVTAFCLD